MVLADPSGGMFDAAGDFDRILPAPAEDFPVLAHIGPFGMTVIPSEDLAALARETARLLSQADEGPERRGLLRGGRLVVAWLAGGLDGFVVGCGVAVARGAGPGRAGRPSSCSLLAG